MNLTVNEIFYSLQGEGGRTGEASIFIRLSKCNLACSFCDTEYESGERMTLDEIVGGSPYGASTIAGGQGQRQPSQIELDGARFQGKLVAETANKLFGK